MNLTKPREDRAEPEEPWSTSAAARVPGGELLVLVLFVVPAAPTVPTARSTVPAAAPAPAAVAPRPGEAPVVVTIAVAMRAPHDLHEADQTHRSNQKTQHEILVLSSLPASGRRSMRASPRHEEKRAPRHLELSTAER